MGSRQGKSVEIFVRLQQFNSPIYGTTIYKIWAGKMSYIKPNSALPRI